MKSLLMDSTRMFRICRRYCRNTMFVGKTEGGGMNYPDKIYPKLEIAEKDICGETHYGLVREYYILGIKFKRHWKVHETLFGGGRVSGYGNRWHNSKTVVESAITRYYRDKEWLFREKMTK